MGIIVEILRRNNVHNSVAAGLPPDFKEILESFANQFHLTRIDPAFSSQDQDTREIITACKNAEAGITWADYGIAHTGAIVEVVSDDAIKIASSLPTIHVALLPASGIIQSVEEAMQKVSEIFNRASREGRVMPVISFISGPSKTSDIEMRLLYGVHGPLSIYVIILGWL